VGQITASRPSQEVTVARKFVDCREMPSESNCSLYISGTEDEVVRAASEHAVSVHGHEDTPELREEIRTHLKDESAVPA
jgi:hypothetical protein